MVVADAAANKAENNDDATILVRVSTEGRLIVVLDVFPLSFLGRKGVERMSVEKDGKKVPLLQQSFIRHGNEQRFWQKESRILAAVSGGVDSMVLLHLLLQAQRQIGFSLGVVHINHQLREESAEEAAYLRSYCEKKNLLYM